MNETKGNRTKHFLLAGIFAALCMHVQAQVPSILLLSPDSSYKQSDVMVSAFGSAMIGSNVLDNLFLEKSLLGGFIEENHIDRIAGKLRDQNRVGFQASGGLSFNNFRDTLFNRPSTGILISLSTNYTGSINFSQDLFKTIYQGNRQFAGDTAQLGPLSFQYQAYQKFGVGLFNKNTLSSVTLSLVAGQEYQSLLLDDAGLFTSINGDSLSLNYSGDFLRSDTTKRGWANGSGLGLALDFNMNLPVQDNQGMISIAVNDIGFIAWNKLSDRFRFDSLTTWQGIEVNDVFHLATDTLDLPGVRDSLHYVRERKAFVTPLPASIHLRFTRFFNPKNLYELGISMYPGRASVPLLYGGLSHFFGQHFMLSERISYGGFGKLGVGAEIQWMPKGTWLFRAGSNHIAGFVMDNTYSRDVYFTLAKIIRSRADKEPAEPAE